MMNVLMGIGGGIPREIVQLVEEQLREHELRTTNLSREGKTLVIPPNMSYDQVIDFVYRKKEEDEAMVDVSEMIEAFPFDAAYALTLVMKDMFGMSNTEEATIQTMFGEMKQKPTFIPVKVAHDKTVQVPWGQFSLPGIDGHISTGIQVKENRCFFLLQGKVRGKYRHVVVDLATAIREKLKTDSIYKGKAIKVSFRDANGKKAFFDPFRSPEFMNLDNPNPPIFTKMTDEQIETSILNPIRHTDACRKNKISLKRTVLLSGRFGTGKTLTALQIALAAQQNGWTFVYVTDCEDLDMAMDLARQYAPSVVFAEDVDRVMKGERDAKMDFLSYCLDGVDTKTQEMVTILTTNDAPAIRKLMLRPGRIDSVIDIEAPDLDTVWRLMQHYGKGMLVGTREEFESSIKPMVGHEPAFITEVLTKSKLRAVGRGAEIKITPDDVAVAVKLMENHVRLFNGSDVETPTREISLSEIRVTVPSDSPAPAPEAAA